MGLQGLGFALQTLRVRGKEDPSEEPVAFSEDAAACSYGEMFLRMNAAHVCPGILAGGGHVAAMCHSPIP